MPRISLDAFTNIDLGDPHIQKKLMGRIRGCLMEFPDFAEGVIELGGVVHWFVYKVTDDVAHVSLLPRDCAEEILNDQGLSTHEEWSPLPGSEHKH